MKIALACGGTGGHIFPGLATAEALRARAHAVTVWLAGKDGEAEAVREWSGPALTVPAEGLPAGLSPKAVRALWRLLGAIRRCGRIMDRDRPHVLLAMGSYASVGPVLAARTLGVPVVLHEANAVPGRAISFLARFADAVAVAFSSAAKLLRHDRVVFTGFPVRPDLDRRFDTGLLQTGCFTVLIMGGSQGAHRLNETACEALCRLHRAGIHPGSQDADGRGKIHDVLGIGVMNGDGQLASQPLPGLRRLGRRKVFSVLGGDRTHRN